MIISVCLLNVNSIFHRYNDTQYTQRDIVRLKPWVSSLNGLSFLCCVKWSYLCVVSVVTLIVVSGRDGGRRQLLLFLASTRSSTGVVAVVVVAIVACRSC